MQKLNPISSSISPSISHSLFSGTSGPRTASAMIVGEAWGAEEARLSAPFVGQSGQEFNRMLKEAGLDRNHFLCTNVVSAQPQFNEFTRFLLPTPKKKVEKDALNYRGLYLSPLARTHLDRLYSLINHVQPKLLIAAGNWPLWALTDHAELSTKKGFRVPAGILTWRGSQTYSIPISGRQYPVLPIIHPAAILREWGFRSITVHDLRSRGKRFLTGTLPWQSPELNSIWRPDFTQLTAILNSWIAICHQRPLPLAVDLETDYPRRKYITVVGLADATCELAIPLFSYAGTAGHSAQDAAGGAANRQISAPPAPVGHSPSPNLRPSVARTYGEQNAPNYAIPYWLEHEELWLWERLKTLLEHPNCKIIGQNFTYDTQWLFRTYGIEAIVNFDTMVAQHLLFPGVPKSLEYLASCYCNSYCYWKNESEGWNASEMSAEQMWRYNCKDTRHTYESAQLLVKLIQKRKLEPQFEFMMEQWELARDMTLRGYHFNREERDRMLTDLIMQTASRASWLESCVPEQISKVVSGKPYFTSPIAMANLLYERLGLEQQKHKKTKKPTTDDSALSELAEKYPWYGHWLDTLSEWRSMNKFREFLEAKEGPDGRMHPQFNVAQPETFRWSSSENSFGEATNNQNIPKVED